MTCAGTAVGVAPAVVPKAASSASTPQPRRFGGQRPSAPTHPPPPVGVGAATPALPAPPLLSGHREAKEGSGAEVIPVDAPHEQPAARAAVAGGQSEERTVKIAAAVGAAEAASAVVGVVKPSPPAATNQPSKVEGTLPKLTPPSCLVGVVRSISGEDRRLGADGLPAAVAKEADSHEGCWAGVLRKVGSGGPSNASPPPPPPAWPPTPGSSLHPRHGRRHPRRRPAVPGAAGNSDSGGTRKASSIKPTASDSGGGGGGEGSSVFLDSPAGGGGAVLAARSHLRDSAGGGVTVMAVGGC